MKNLDKNWITDKIIDKEYKRYILLAYLKEVSKQFDKSLLFPYYSDLNDHYNNLKSIKLSVDDLFRQFPGNISGIDWDNLSLIYNKTTGDSDLIKEIKEIINYSLPKIKNCITDGMTIYDYFKDHIHLNPIGIVPLNHDEGYLFLHNSSDKNTLVYQYNITIYNKPDVPYKSMHTKFLISYRKNFVNTDEAIKGDLLRVNTNLPNPATYSVESDISIPLNETLLPMAKEALLKYLSDVSGQAVN